MHDFKFWRNENYILCPHCEYEIKDWKEYYLLEEDGHEFNLFCPKCNKEMQVLMNIEVLFTSTKPIEEE